jgi:hypothetical protein
MQAAVSDGRKGLSFTIAFGPRQLSHSRVRVPWDSWSYFSVSHSRFPSSSPPTTRRVTVEIFDPNSKRDSTEWLLMIFVSFVTRYEQRTEHTFERFVSCNLRIRCHGNSCLATCYLVKIRSVVMETGTGTLLSNGFWSCLHYSGFQPSRHNRYVKLGSVII